MSWESIIGFIAIALISSIFNKGKNQTTQRRTSNDRRSPNPSRPMEAPNNNSSRPTVGGDRPVSQQSPKKSSKTVGLEEMIRELQKNMGDVFNQSTAREEIQQEKATKAVEEEKIKKRIKDVKSLKEVVSVSNQSTVSPILENEIGRGNVGKVKFNRHSILQGLIMSEVLEKPKSLRR
ncbi:hypothetical protein [Alkaliphilus hydrothermalis]|uniref:Uncharacterized protein n=1 Tax=Alkaliphilus hydrothermalis TaxID=1482730 RepID=A0ABS2NNZ4_9FIRM|nr:hypothetical protein [Alkaliphilus hydrothermalis]MBM7614650.1 hypothetical protein [Alkaliphilus hydrothermalis]